MKKNILKSIGLVFFGVILGGALMLMLAPGKRAQISTSSTGKPERKIKYWTCSMHPQVKMDNKGLCPICGMDLIPIYDGGDDNDDEATLTLGERARKLAVVRTSTVGKRKLTRHIQTVAKIDYDETKVAYISAWNNGRIDKLYVDFTGMKVKKGQRLALLYSPELISAQQEYLLTYKTRGKKARSKLRLLGISDSQIKKIEKAKEPLTHLTVSSPITGTVIKKNIKSGQYVKTGNLLYTIADLSNLWVYLDVYEYDVPWVSLGQTVMISVESYPEKEFEGVITFIDPFLNEKTRTLKVRVDVKNLEGKLKPGMFAYAHIHDAMMDGMKNNEEKMLAVPKSAVLDTGLRKIVFVEVESGKYSLREVITGALAGDYYPVASGLSEGEVVVTSGNFLIDSQMQLTGKPSIMFTCGSKVDPHAAMGHTSGGSADEDMDDVSFDDLSMDDVTFE